jgi:hypothetical protein
MPGDWEIQAGLGRDGFALHGEERLAMSDKEVAMLRRLLKRQIDIVRRGGDPIGVTFDPDALPFHMEAGNVYLDRPKTIRRRSRAPRNQNRPVST